MLTLEPIVLSATAGSGHARIKGRAEVNSLICSAIDERAAQHHLGSALGGVTPTPDGLGWSRRYPAGWVVYRADRGARAVYGAIGARWMAFGGTESFLGWPATDHLHSAPTIDRIPGHHTRFDGGLVIWSAPTGAFELHGEILDLWRQLGAESGALGLPLSDEHDLVQHGTTVGRRNVFQHGEISWSPGGGAAVTALSHPYDVADGGSAVRIAGIGGGGDEPPLPAIRRFLRGNVTLAMTGDDFGRWQDGDRGSAVQHVEAAVDSWDPAAVSTVVGTTGALSVAVDLTSMARPDGSVFARGTVSLHEGPENAPTAQGPVQFVIPEDETLNLSVHIALGDPPGDHAEVLISLRNHAV